ncbi:MAG TPA: S41 family peptidase [Kofleriaceae bacterium]|nr:S41 family peptidase [Kofleriaceae bacterium]
MHRGERVRRRGVLVCAVAAIVLLASASSRSSRADPMPDRSERVLGLARLWAKAKFFHPYLAYKPIDWDAALVAAIPKVEAATTPAAYRAALAELLGKLGDPVTRMIDPPAAPAATAPPKDWLTWPAPGVLEVQVAGITAGGYDYVAFGAKGKQIAGEAAKAKVMIVDLRTGAAEPSLGEQAVEQFVVALPAIEQWPLQRTVEHRGYRTQHGLTTGGYFSTFVTVGALPAKAAPKTGPHHVVFVADARSVLPPAALALQAAGRATIVSAAALSEESIALTEELELPAGLTAQLRLGELLWGPPAADVRVGSAAELHARALAIAKAAASKPAKPRKMLPLPPLVARDDLDYPDPVPSRERRILAAIRIWATLEYFSPYRYLIEDWDGAFRTLLPRIEAATTRDDYLTALRQLAVRANDGHIGVFPASPDPAAKPRGVPPIGVRLVENQLAVVKLVDRAETERAGIGLGDVIENLDGQPVADYLAQKRLVISGSTKDARDQRVASNALGGDDGSRIELVVRDAAGKRRTAVLTRKAAHLAALLAPPATPHYKPLGNGIGYVDLTQLVVPEVAPMFEALKDTKAIIFDLRGYPNGTIWSIAPRVNTNRAPYAAQFLEPLVAGGGGGDQRIRFFQPVPALPAGAALYRGKIVVLIDDRAISQAEHTCLFLQEAAGATFVGSPTAGANGDVTVLRLPGGLRMGFTGQEVRHVDGKQLQQVGIQPHLAIRPTLAGIRAGKDEVLDRALAYLATGK